MTTCDNCGSSQGPFVGIGYGKRVCKITPDNPHKDINKCSCRLSLCVQRRAKIDYDLYEKNQITPYL